jgi:gliding motility-associated-like protein
VTFTVTVNPIITPAFTFGTSLSVCSGASVPSLPLSSTNGVTGTWSPSSIDNLNSATYTFTPNAGQCANGTSLDVTVNANVTPTFPFGTNMTTCQGSAVPTLSTTSSEGITGTWNPAAINNQNSATYTFTPTAGLCATTTTFDVTITPNTIPTFTFGTSLSICAGDPVPSLPTTSNNGLTGSWNPSTVDNQSSAVYTFTPDPIAGQCLAPATFTVTVNQILTPAFSFGTNLAVCSGSTPPALPLISQNGVAGTWSPTVIDNQNPGTYTFTSNAGQCATPTATLTVTITQTPTVGSEKDTTVTDGSLITSNSFSGTPAGVSFNWTNSNSGIGLSASGSGNVPSFTATNKGNSNIKGTVTVTPVFNGCSGSTQNYTITVIPLDKDVFVPNVFSPNGDGKNDFLYVYGNYISTLEMRIFNQWGQQVQLITDVRQGWDGRYNGQPQPVGVYVYTLKAVMTDGRTVQLKGSITLVR